MIDKDVLADIQRIELELLKAVVFLCDRYNLRYSIYCGTLLGAVRHRGFIPWDDDVDLVMPLKDYRIFLKHADELPPGITCLHRNNVKDYHHLWAKVAKDNTTFMPVAYAGLDIHWGISLDIYPMIGTPNTAIGKELQKIIVFVIRRLQFVPVYSAQRFPGRFKFLKWILASSPFFIRQGLINMFSYICMRNIEGSVSIGTIDAAPFEGKYKREDWKDMTKLLFEDAYYTAPVRYDKILRKMYGDYMKLPPEEARTIHIKGEVIIDPHRDYRLYRKELLGK